MQLASLRLMHQYAMTCAPFCSSDWNVVPRKAGRPASTSLGTLLVERWPASLRLTSQGHATLPRRMLLSSCRLSTPLAARGLAMLRSGASTMCGCRTRFALSHHVTWCPQCHQASATGKLAARYGSMTRANSPLSCLGQCGTSCHHAIALGIIPCSPTRGCWTRLCSETLAGLRALAYGTYLQWMVADFLTFR